MAITSLKPIKAKNSRRVLAKSWGETAETAGYTDSESRGIFGKYHEYTEDEIKRIDDYWSRKSENELEYYKVRNADVPTRMQERQRKAMAKVMEMAAD